MMLQAPRQFTILLGVLISGVTPNKKLAHQAAEHQHEGSMEDVRSGFWDLVRIISICSISAESLNQSKVSAFHAHSRAVQSLFSLPP
jgi:hypothetical protein